MIPVLVLEGITVPNIKVGDLNKVSGYYVYIYTIIIGPLMKWYILLSKVLRCDSLQKLGEGIVERMFKV